MRIYLESTIPSYVVARPARDLLQAARQQLTRDWWDLTREHHELFTSQVVLDEIADGDAAHIALATVHGLDVLLTWNCRHIANVAIQQRLRRLAEQSGYTLPSLATPEEFMND